MEIRSRVGTMLVKIATVYLVLGLAGGMFVAVTERYELMSAHSHASLVGWTTMGLAGLVYVVFPACERSRLAAVHFWLHNVGLPLMVFGLISKAVGDVRAETFLALGSTIVLVAMLTFAVNVMTNARG